MNATADQTRDALRALRVRSTAEIVGDLRSVARVLLRELEVWGDKPPHPAAMTSAETSVEGVRRLLVQLRLSRMA
jgi:hypothetical protein